MSTFTEMRVSYTARGLARYEIEVQHEGLKKHQLIKGDDAGVVKRRGEMKAREWDESWDRQEAARDAKRRGDESKNAEAAAKAERKSAAERLTAEAQSSLRALDDILKNTLAVDDAVDWESLKDYSTYPEPAPEMPVPPAPPTDQEIPEKPRRGDPRFEPKIGILDRLFPQRRALREKEAEELFLSTHARWEMTARGIYEANQHAKGQHRERRENTARAHEHALKDWQRKKADYLEKRDNTNAAIDDMKRRYLSGDPDSIREYCDMVLARSVYPDFFPKTYDLEYRPETKALIVEYDLPTPSDLPAVKEVKYVPSRGEYEEKRLTPRQINENYDAVIYKVALRTIHELFEADTVNGLATIAFNGLVTAVDPATGLESTKCIMSLQVNRAEFMEINLHAVEPKACFKKLKGVGSSQLYSITPVAPIMQMDREDRRFAASYAVVETIDAGTNVAAMDWEDFEHLIREIFEREFSAGGGEVKVTRASRDGGVDGRRF